MTHPTLIDLEIYDETHIWTTTWLRYFLILQTVELVSHPQCHSVSGVPGPMILPGYLTIDSASSSKFHHLTLLVVLVSHSSPLALACHACGASVALG